MNINILELIEGARAARGLTVIIDVFRAMTVEAYVINNGAKDLIPIRDIDEAYAYQEAHPGTILIGERGGAKCPGFDFGNSPFEIKDVDFSGKTVVHTTSAGTQGIANATHATEIVAGNIVCAMAIADYIKKSGAEEVSLVCMGLAGVKPTREDRLCAEYIKSLVDGTCIDLKKGVEECMADDGAKFFDPEKQNVFPEEDFWLSVEANKFDFVMQVQKGGDGLMHTVRRV